MAHLRAPAPRADRREGGRHGRPVARTAPALPEAHIRSQLRRLAVLPPVAVALGACAAVLFTVRSTGADPGPALWAVLAGAFSVALAGILTAAVAADRAARSFSDRVTALRRGSARGEADLRALVASLRRGETPPARAARGGPPDHPDDPDDFDLLACDLARAHDSAVAAVVQAAQLSSQTGDEQKLEVFVNLARRLQSLVHREISTLDELENQIEDPDLLKGLFHVDHLATRIRRHAENLAVLGGAVSRRQWSTPVPMTEVLRSAIAEVEQYARVRLVPPVAGTLRGHAVADVIHLLAELVENATVFSAPHTQVLLRVNLVTSGLAVEVEDRGLGMPPDEQHRMNALLADPDQVNVARLLADGRIGLYVVSQLARRHGIGVRLQSNIYGGVQAVLVVPQELLGGAPAAGGMYGTPLEAAPAPQTIDGPGDGGHGGGGQLNGAQLHGFQTDGTLGNGFQPHGAQTNGVQPHGAQVNGGLPHGTPAHGIPAHGSAAHGTPAGGAPVHGTPAHGVPLGGLPLDGAPVNGGPVIGAPVHGLPLDGASVNVDPVSAVADHGAPLGGPSVPTVPAPLPVRGTHQERANPAEAVPGVRPEQQRLLADRPTEPPTPRVGPVHGTMAKPHLPRRRAQEHLVPELRGGPLPRPADGPPAGHDPGLMAAFQRGVGMAEAQQRLEDGTDTGALRMESAYTGPVHMDRESLLAGRAPLEVRHPAPARREPAPSEPVHTGVHPPDPAHPHGVPHPEASPTDPRPALDVTALDVTALGVPHRDPARHDGSPSAG